MWYVYSSLLGMYGISYSVFAASFCIHTLPGEGWGGAEPPVFYSYQSHTLTHMHTHTHTHTHTTLVPESLVGGEGWEGEGGELTVMFTFCTWCITPLSSGTVPRPLSVSTGPMTVMPLSPMATTTMEYLTSSGHWFMIPSTVKI